MLRQKLIDKKIGVSLQVPKTFDERAFAGRVQLKE